MPPDLSTMCAGNPVQDETAIDASYVISLIRAFLHSSQPQDEQDACKLREEAGCALWDMSSSDAISTLLVQNRLVDVIEVTLSSELSKLQTQDVPATRRSPQQEAQADSCINHRAVEICMGILANLCSHDGLSSHLLQGELPSLLLGSAFCLTDPACLSELCRLLSVALRKEERKSWLQLLSTTPSSMQQLMFIASNTLDPTCLERCLDTLVAVLHADELERQSTNLEANNTSPQQQQQQHVRDATCIEEQQQQHVRDATCIDEQQQYISPPADGGAAAMAGDHPFSGRVQASQNVCCISSDVMSGLLDIVVQVLSAACAQLCPLDEDQQNKQNDADRGCSGTDRVAGNLLWADNESCAAADVASSADAALEQQKQQVMVTDVAVDTALTLLAEMAVSSAGRRSLQLADPSQPAVQQAVQGAGITGTAQQEPTDASQQQQQLVASGVADQQQQQKELTQGPVASSVTSAQLLPGLLLQLLMLTESCQVMESLVIVMVDLSQLLLPLLVAEPQPLGRLVDVVAEVPAGAQEQVIEAAWFLTAATLQHGAAPHSMAPAGRSSGDNGREPLQADVEVSESNQTGTVPPPMAPAGIGMGQEVLQADVEVSRSDQTETVVPSQDLQLLSACKEVVRRLQLLPISEGCQKYVERCATLLR